MLFATADALTVNTDWKVTVTNFMFWWVTYTTDKGLTQNFLTEFLLLPSQHPGGQVDKYGILFICVISW